MSNRTHHAQTSLVISKSAKSRGKGRPCCLIPNLAMVLSTAGYAHRSWVMQTTPTCRLNFVMGWTPVKAEDHPELQVLPDHDSRFEGNVEVGGLLLCENSTEFVDSRTDAHHEMNAQSIECCR